MRLGVYADLIYHRQGDAVTTDRAFIQLVAAMSATVDELVVFGRLAPEPGTAPYELPPTCRFVPLPYYPRVTDVRGVLRALRATAARFDAELPHLDAVWVFGPYPVSLLIAALALRRRTRLFLGVRQDLPSYIRGRLPGPRWTWAIAVAWAFEWTWRLLSRRAPAVTVGEALGDAYRRAGGRVHSTAFSLVRADDLVAVDDAVARPFAGRLLSVGRLDSEKNPLLLIDALARLRERDSAWTVTVVGTGPLAGAMADRARALAVDDAVTLKGYVPAGDALWREYREASIFVHVSLTEGLPQVLFEAQAAGTPIVATAVGGVPAALAADAALLVPPRDAGALVAAVERLRDDPRLRAKLVARGLEDVRGRTLEATITAILDFFDQSERHPSERARAERANDVS